MSLFDEDHVLKTPSTKNKAKKNKKDGCLRKKKSCVFKHSVTKHKSVSTHEEFDIVSSGLDDDDLFEAKRTWDLGKQIGLLVENGDEIIAVLALVRQKVLILSITRQRERGRKRSRGKYVANYCLVSFFGCFLVFFSLIVLPSVCLSIVCFCGHVVSCFGTVFPSDWFLGIHLLAL